MSDTSGLYANWIRLLKAFGITKYDVVIGRTNEGMMLHHAYDTAVSKLDIKVPTWSERCSLFVDHVSRAVFSRELGVEKPVTPKTSVVSLIELGPVVYGSTKINDEVLFDEGNEKFFVRIRQALRSNLHNKSTMSPAFDMADILNTWGWSGGCSKDQFVSAVSKLPIVPISGDELSIPSLRKCMGNGFIIKYGLSENHKNLNGLYSISGLTTPDELMSDIESAPEIARERFNASLDCPRSRSVLAGYSEDNQYNDVYDTLGLLVSLGLVGVVFKPRAVSKKTGKPTPGIMCIVGALPIGYWLRVCEKWIGADLSKLGLLTR